MRRRKMQQLMDRSEIVDLVSRLGVVLDEGRFDEMQALFVEDATARTPGGTAEGREALVAQASRNHGPDQRVQHVITNVLVDLEGDRASVRANLAVNFTVASVAGAPVIAPIVQFTLGEVYRFAVVRTGEGWRVARVGPLPVGGSGTPPVVRRAPRAAALATGGGARPR